MELFLFRHAEFERIYQYNCSQIRPDSIPLERRQFKMPSVAIVTLCTIYYVLYVFCMFSLYHRRQSACHKLLFFIGLIDLSILWMLGYYVGYMSWTGRVFCSNPTLGYLTGSFCTSLWMCESSADLMLAINRCVKILSEKLYSALFSGRRIFIWCALSTAYFLFWLIFMRPAVYSSIYFGGWFFNPYAGYIDLPTEMCQTKLHIYHNYLIAIGLPSCYLIFALAFVIKYKTKQIDSLTRAELMIFLQVFLISALNAGPALFYVHIQCLGQISRVLMATSQFLWLHIHGFPPVIYLLLNKPIQNDCKQIVANFYGQYMPSRFRRNGTTERVGATRGWIT